MIPDLQSSLICDDVRQERNGKFILIGLFDAIGANEFPLRYPRVFMVTRWCGGEGSFTQHSRILKPNQTDVLIEGKDIPVKLPNPEASTTNVEVFVNVTFEEAGTHWIEVLLDGDIKIRYPLRVNRVASQNQPPPGG